MKTNELVAGLKAGKLLAIAEWRGADAAPIEYMDKITGKKSEITGIRHVLEFGSKSISAREDVPDDFKFETWNPKLKKGQLVVVEVKSHGWVKGRGETMRIASIVPFED